MKDLEVKAEYKPHAEALIKRSQDTLFTALGMEFTMVDPTCMIATMPVDQRTKQPFGLLHGGASVALAETLASTGAYMNVDQSKYNVVGLEINANHLRPAKQGIVTGTAKPIHIGQKTQIWEIKITNEEGKLTCISRCTLAVVPKLTN